MSESVDILTGAECARMASLSAWSSGGVILGRTQMQKILYVCYGLWLAHTGSKLFDDVPVAWLYGPVFPSVFRGYIAEKPDRLTDAERGRWKGFDDQGRLIVKVAGLLRNKSAGFLTAWSHRTDGPWYASVAKHGLGHVIDEDAIKDYFSDGSDRWRKGLLKS